MRIANISPVGLACLLAFGQAPAADTPRIHLEPAEGERWRVRYETASPVGELRLRRNPDDSRVARWVSVHPEQELVHVDGEDRIRRVDGKQFSSAAFDVSATYVPLPKDYAPFASFGDGGLLIHSGRFQACRGPCPDGAGDLSWQFSIAAPADARVLVAGRDHARVASWTDTGDGTKVYVGAATPLVTPDLIAVVDGAFPAGLRGALFELFPAMMERYAERLGGLPARPMLFASHDAGYAEGYGAQGGTLPGQVFMHLYGPGWDDGRRDEEKDAWIHWFFAHEAAHLYQGRNPTGEGESEAWIHEGGAEAFAALLLRELNVASDDYVNRRIRDAESACEAAIAARPLNESAAAGSFRDYYACGLLIHLAIDAAARRASGGDRDLFDVWRSFEGRVARGAKRNQVTFLETVRLEGGAEIATAISEIVSERPADPSGALGRLGY